MTENKHNSFRENLLSQEQVDVRQKENFQLEVKKMFTENLKKGQRTAYVLTSFFIAILTLLFWVFAKLFEMIQFDQGIAAVESLRLTAIWAMYLGVVLIIFSM